MLILFLVLVKKITKKIMRILSISFMTIFFIKDFKHKKITENCKNYLIQWIYLFFLVLIR